MTQPINPGERPRRYRLGQVAAALDALGTDRKVRGNAKAMALAGDAGVQAIKSFTYAGLDITVLSAGNEPMANGHTALRVVVEASRGGQPVHVDNPYLFANPPILVPNPADPGETVENIAEAFRQMVGEAVRGVAERQR